MHDYQSLFYLEDALARQETAIDLFKTDAAKRVLVIDIARTPVSTYHAPTTSSSPVGNPCLQTASLSTGRGKDPTSESEFTHCAGEHTAF
jgi:hypothetical protein